MKFAAIRCTDNSAPQGVLDYCLDNLYRVIPKTIDVFHSVKPANMPRCQLTLYKQLLSAAESTDADFVFITEHDVIYDASHFTLIPKRDDVFYYNFNVFVLTERGYAVTGRVYLSQLCAPRKLLIQSIQERILFIKTSGENIPFYEPAYKDPFTKFEKHVFISQQCNVDIRHGSNITLEQRNPIKPPFYTQIGKYKHYKDLRREMELE